MADPPSLGERLASRADQSLTAPTQRCGTLRGPTTMSVRLRAAGLETDPCANHGLER